MREFLNLSALKVEKFKIEKKNLSKVNYKINDKFQGKWKLAHKIERNFWEIVKIFEQNID